MEKRLLAIDYGEKRIGLAMTDPLRMFAKPYETMPNKGIDDFTGKLESIIKEKNIGEIIVGIPWGLDGTETDKTKETRSFLETLQARLDIPVSGYDERFTTSDANDLLKEMGYNWKEARYVIDAMAACVILKRYMERTTDGR